MPLIKLTESRGGFQPSPLDFDDLSQQADAYLDQVRARAAEMIGQAKREAAALRQQAEAAGRAAAEQSVQQRVEQVAEELTDQRVQSLLPALEQAAAGLRQAGEDWLAHWEAHALELASAIAARVIRRELSHAPEIPRELLREALELAAGSTHLRVRLNPVDQDVLGDSAKQLAAQLVPRASIEWLADPAISPGGCVVETEYGRIDQRIESQLKRIEEELAGV
jgi:flagellar assembly protein FliH